MFKDKIQRYSFGNGGRKLIFLSSFLLFVGTHAHAQLQPPSGWSFGNDWEEMAGGGLKRPGVPQPYDDNGEGVTGQGHGPNFAYRYEAITFPSPTRGYWWSQQGPGTINVDLEEGIGVDTYAKTMGVTYQSNGDVGRASFTSVRFGYRVRITRMKAQYHKAAYALFTKPKCALELRFTPSDGPTPGPYSVNISPDSAASLGVGPLSFDIDLTDGTASPSGVPLNFTIPVGPIQTGPHAAKSFFNGPPITVSSRGEIKIEDETDIGRAFGEIAWDLFIETGNKQVPYRFPAPRTGNTIIKFLQ